MNRHLAESWSSWVSLFYALLFVDHYDHKYSFKCISLIIFYSNYCSIYSTDHSKKKHPFSKKVSIINAHRFRAGCNSPPVVSYLTVFCNNKPTSNNLNIEVIADLVKLQSRRYSPDERRRRHIQHIILAVWCCFVTPLFLMSWNVQPYLFFTRAFQCLV